MSRVLGPHHQPPARLLVEREVLDGGGLGCVPVETSCRKGRRSSADLLLMTDGLAYTFLVGPSALGAPIALTFNGAGIVINAGSATINNQGSSQNTTVTFSGNSTAGNVNNAGSLNFCRRRPRPECRHPEHCCAVNFRDRSTASNAPISNQG
jgi:hypothetical protein